ncbi:Gfo/Idh/MocA family protein [Nitrospira sp. KM1]|uniref:Gfo/Idh/MocA family protein n=1 Tax=Nitrospira sp. KM1 TaxID=1936990 RepID=UPI001567545B|nr:Gfo/Idh/MocA family oxidoreductase [Nitrospira sp. KM1]
MIVLPKGPIGVGLVGVGRHGSRYARYLAKDVPGAVLAAICRKRVEEQLPFDNVSVYGDFRDLIADPRVHAVVVVTSPLLCHDICLEAVRAGKPVLVEKPLAFNGAQARSMVAEADRASVPLMTAQTMRFDPTILKLKEQLGLIGRLQTVTLRSHIETKANVLSDHGTPVSLGALLELGIHMLDLVRFATGEEVARVQAVLVPPADEGPEQAVQARMLTAEGIECLLDVARVEGRRQGWSEWVGSEGMLRADWCCRTVRYTDRHGESTEWIVEPEPTVLAVLMAFIRAIRDGVPPPITGADGCRAVELADACYRSSETGGAWMDVASLD